MDMLVDHFKEMYKKSSQIYFYNCQVRKQTDIIFLIDYFEPEEFAFNTFESFALINYLRRLFQKWDAVLKKKKYCNLNEVYEHEIREMKKGEETQYKFTNGAQVFIKAG